MLTHAIHLTLPEIAFSVANIYPFRSELAVGKPKWYDKISIAYSMDGENTVNTIVHCCSQRTLRLIFNMHRVLCQTESSKASR